VALATIRRVTEEGGYSNLVLAAELGRSRLSARDRRLAADLALGTMRRLLVLDAAIAAVADRPLDQIDPPALAVLRLGAYQLQFTRIPDHAAVSSAVELAPRRSKGFVNALLRRLAAAPHPQPAGDEDEAVSARTGLAPWAVAELRRVLPSGEVEEAAAALARPADLTLRANTCRVSKENLDEELRRAGYEPVPGRHHPDVLRVPSAVPALLPGFAQGWFAIQDEASVLVAAAVEATRGEAVLDACAGPGGKATHLACMIRPGRVVAADLRPKRARLVQAAARRVGVTLDVLAQDAARPALGRTFDAVLVDAPCSGLGAARRRPELLWRPSRSSLAGLARLQVAIMVGSADLVRPGGRLVYSVCTFPRAETDAAVRAFLAKRPDFEPLPVPGIDGRAPAHRLWPHRDGTDAMFYAGFRRLGEGDTIRPT